MASSTAALAVQPPAGHVVSPCILGLGGDSDTQIDLAEDIAKAMYGCIPSQPSSSPNPSCPYPWPKVDFVVAYSLQNDNDGQSTNNPVAGYTGPVLCSDPDKVQVLNTTENTPVPNGADQTIGAEGAWSTVDIQAMEQMLITQYRKSGDLTNATREKKICQTVAGNTDCFIIKPASPTPE